MKLRVILLIMAILVIGWIIWDHNRKNVKTNKYVEKKTANQIFFGFITNLFSNLFTKKNKRRNPNLIINSAHKKNHDYNNEHNDIDLDQNFDQDFDQDYMVATGFDEFDTLHDETKGKFYLQDDLENPPVKSRVNTKIDFDYYSDMLPDTPQIQKTQPAPQNTHTKQQQICLVSMHIKARNNKKFSGDELLQALISVGCRFGDMSIFHRHEKASGHGKVMFSIASMVKPGTFEIERMHYFTTPGITLFFSMPSNNEHDPLMVYDLMLKTAYKIAKLLDADILDDNRELLTNTKVDETKQLLENNLAYEN